MLTCMVNAFEQKRQLQMDGWTTILTSCLDSVGLISYFQVAAAPTQMLAFRS